MLARDKRALKAEIHHLLVDLIDWNEIVDEESAYELWEYVHSLSGIAMEEFEEEF